MSGAQHVFQTHALTKTYVRDQGHWAVFRIEQGRARLRPVEVGALTDESAEIRAGLRPQDRVLVYPSDQIRDGTRVTPRAG